MKSCLFLLVIGYVVTCVAGQCTLPEAANECPRQRVFDKSGNPECCVWNTIYNNGSIYDTDPASVEDTLCRPNGFAYATWYYQKPHGINQPCVSLTCSGASSSCWVQISVETSPPSSLCVKDNLGGQPSCGEGSFSICFRMKAATVSYSFECQTGCAENSVTFWYRFNTFMPKPGEDGNDLCNLHTVLFPSNLVKLPVDQNPQNPTLAPTRNSTVASTRNFTMASTKNTTVAPTRNATVAPTRNAAVAPTRNAAVAPTSLGDCTVASTRSSAVAILPTLACVLTLVSLFVLMQSIFY